MTRALVSSAHPSANGRDERPAAEALRSPATRTPQRWPKPGPRLWVIERERLDGTLEYLAQSATWTDRIGCALLYPTPATAEIERVKWPVPHRGTVKELPERNVCPEDGACMNCGRVIRWVLLTDGECPYCLDERMGQ